jgi:hypothetical protein
MTSDKGEWRKKTELGNELNAPQMNWEKGRKKMRKLIFYFEDYQNFSSCIQMLVQSTGHQTIHFGLCTALISRALALIANCNCIT